MCVAKYRDVKRDTEQALYGKSELPYVKVRETHQVDHEASKGYIHRKEEYYRLETNKRTVYSGVQTMYVRVQVDVDFFFSLTVSALE